MKKLFFAVALLCVSQTFPCFAQMITKGCNAPAIKAFQQQGHLYVVLTDDTSFNQWLRAAVKEQWTASSYGFINSTDIDSSVRSDKNFLLYAQSKDEKAVIHLLNTDDVQKKKEFYIVLSQGGYKQTKYLFSAPLNGPKVVGSFRFAPESTNFTIGMKECELLLSLLNQSLKIIIDNRIKTEVKDSVKWMISDGNASSIKEKTLLISRAYNDGTFSLDDKDIISNKVLEDYPFDYSLVGRDSAEILLNDGSSNYCYLLFYFPAPRFKTTDDSGDILVYDPSQKKFIYFEDNMDGPWFEKWKMKEMVAAIKAK